MPSICDPIIGQPVMLARDTYPHLFGLNLADNSDTSESLGINILIGTDNYWSWQQGECIVARQDLLL